MDRRERYDPEDIESLLRERNYDELLDEERAYVLRHLTGRDEYEHMRMLLQNLHGADRSRSPIEADLHVRQAVLGVFRQHRTSAWRIWLNTLGGLIPIPTGSLNLRPVLAFGTVLLLVVGGVMVLRYMTGDGVTKKLAEVRTENVPKAPPANGASQPVNTDLDRRSDLAEDEVITPAVEEELGVTNGALLIDKLEEVEVLEVERELAAAAPMEEDHMELAQSTTISREENAKDVRSSAGSPSDIDTQPSSRYATSESRAVGAAEMLRNQSMAAATEERTRTRERTVDRSNVEIRGRSLAEDAPLIDLLVAGW